jgi:hypothetical protein
MKTRYSIDRESFQVFLANAFAVQESGLDPQSLSALVEVQGFMTSEEFDLDRAMQMIAERALGVCGASGVAVALLEANKNELVYKAGSGSAAKDVGRRVPAVLSASSPHENRREILRVENAESDKRIDAEICRQFGATALLMVPIYKAHALVGVLQVLFEEPHCFVEREIRTYRLMVSALEDGFLRELDVAQKQPAANAVEQISTVPVPPEHYPQAVEKIVATEILPASGQQNISGGFLAQGLETTASATDSSTRDHVAILVRELNALWNAFTKAIAAFEARAWNANSRYAGPAIACVLAVTIIVLISHLNHRSDASISSSISTLQDAQQQAPVKPLFVNDQTKSPSDEQKEISSPGQGFRRVRIGPDEVDYISADVTIRRFEARPAKPQIRKGVGKEISFGDDVTVRYFANTSATASQQPASAETTPATNQSSFQSQ